MNKLHSLMAHWRMDEASGTRNDVHGNNHLADNNTVTQAAGRIKSAAQFTATNFEYLSVTNNADLAVGDIDFTVAGWVYFDSASDCGIVKKESSDSANAGYRLDVESSVLRFFVFNAGTVGFVTSSVTPTTGTWYFVVAWHDSAADEVGISVNGTVNTAGTSGAPLHAADDVQFGRLNSSVFLDGRLDAWSFWRRVLTSTERGELYNGVGLRDYPWMATGFPRSRIVNGS
jgi:hypothetical protein